MSLTDYKIKQSDIESKGVVAAPDVMSGTAQENKAVFDRLIREAVAVQFNALVDALAAVTGAGEIGAAVDGVEATTALGVMAALKVLHDTTAQTQSATNASVQTALGNRYTKDQTDSLLGQKFDTATANEMVRSISFNAETGVFTVTTQGGAISTIDTMLERVPASFTLENNQLVLTLEDGTRQTADLSAFIDTYTFTSGSTVSFSQSGKDITAEVRDGSLALSKLTPEAQETLASYANRAEAAQEGAQAAQAAAEAARDAAQIAAATANEKAATSSSSAAAAGASASASAGSASAAKTSEDNAKASETASKAAQRAAEQARDEAQAIAGGDYLPLAGGTMTGKLTLDGAPSADLHAATKKYVDDAVGNIPTPDVSGQINTHNDDPNAHATIRASLNNVYNKVISMGEQLVVNGTGFMGNNTNFSWWDFDGSQGNGSPASFTKAAKIGGMVGLDELIPVNATKPYEWKLDLKSEKGISTFYTFVQCYDADMLEINSYNVRFRDGSTTKLSKDLVAGDSVLHLEDVSGWLASMNGYTDAIIWNYKNSFGYAYPKETYSRTKLPLLVSGGNITIDTVNKTVALKNAYTGETIPAGTDLSQGTPGHAYTYYPLSNVTIPTVWTSYSGVLEGTDIFFRGTAYVRLKMFWNDNYADDRQWMTNVSFREWHGGVTTEEMNTAIATATANLATKDHTQAASTITAGTLGGEVSANSSGQTVGNSVLRNSKLVSADTTPTVNGEIYWTYE